jgi:hypothetical protein
MGGGAERNVPVWGRAVRNGGGWGGGVREREDNVLAAGTRRPDLWSNSLGWCSRCSRGGLSASPPAVLGRNVRGIDVREPTLTPESMLYNRTYIC